MLVVQIAGECCRRISDWVAVKVALPWAQNFTKVFVSVMSGVWMVAAESTHQISGPEIVYEEYGVSQQLVLAWQQWLCHNIVHNR